MTPEVKEVLHIIFGECEREAVEVEEVEKLRDVVVDGGSIAVGDDHEDDDEADDAGCEETDRSLGGFDLLDVGVGLQVSLFDEDVVLGLQGVLVRLFELSFQSGWANTALSAELGLAIFNKFMLILINFQQADKLQHVLGCQVHEYLIILDCLHLFSVLRDKTGEGSSVKGLITRISVFQPIHHLLIMHDLDLLGHEEVDRTAYNLRVAVLHESLEVFADSDDLKDRPVHKGPDVERFLIEQHLPRVQPFKRVGRIEEDGFPDEEAIFIGVAKFLGILGEDPLVEDEEAVVDIDVAP